MVRLSANTGGGSTCSRDGLVKTLLTNVELPTNYSPSKLCWLKHPRTSLFFRGRQLHCGLTFWWTLSCVLRIAVNILGIWSRKRRRMSRSAIFDKRSIAACPFSIVRGSTLPAAAISSYFCSHSHKSGCTLSSLGGINACAWCGLRISLG